MAKELIIRFQYDAWFSDQVRKSFENAQEKAAELNRELTAVEQVAGQILDAGSISADAVKKKADARFKRIDVLKQIVEVGRQAVSLYAAASRESIGHQHRIETEVIPALLGEIAEQIQKIPGFGPAQCREFAARNERVINLQKEAYDAQGRGHNGIPTWRQLLQQDIKEFESLLQEAVKRAVG